MIELNKVVFAPSVLRLGGTVMDFTALDKAVSVMGAEEAAETEGSPLDNILSRIAMNPNEQGNGDDIAEFAGRQCYRSWMSGRGPAEYIGNLIEMGHGSVFEHASMPFMVTGVSRSLTHELIRHRVGTAYSQESQRYVDAKDLRFVVPPLLANHCDGMDEDMLNADPMLGRFRTSCGRALAEYKEFQADLIAMLADMEAAGADIKQVTSAKKRANEAARALLPNAAETRLVFTCNLREIRHVLLLRGNEAADLEIRRLAVVLLEHSRDYAPHFFADVVKTLGADNLAAIGLKIKPTDLDGEGEKEAA